jgi:NADH-quinone oxidoreductase subunit G
MTEHVCPVGALTSRDFRFKARVWFLKSAPSVCSGCATGCNTHADYDPRVNQVYRLRPRDNLAVNQFWMCDDGMMTYKEVHEGRVLVPTHGRGQAAEELTYAESISLAAEKLRAVDGAKVGVVLSATCSSEDNLVLFRFAKDVLGTDKLYMAARAGWQGDDILRSVDHNPNRAGVKLVAGRDLPGLDALVGDVTAGTVTAALLLGAASVESVAELSELTKLDSVVSLTASAGDMPAAASLVIPVSSWAEMHGTYVNAKGMTQAFKRVIPSPGRIQPAWQTLLAIAAEMGKKLGFTQLNDVRAALSAPPAQGAAPEARV